MAPETVEPGASGAGTGGTGAPGPGNRVIYTVGTSTRTREEFLELLQAYGVRVLLDVRRFPNSRRYPHFSRAELATWLTAAGVSYHYLGDSLGGFRHGGYEEYTETESFRAGLAQATDLAERAPAVIMCCERLPSRCHRRFIARRLEDLGWRVIHIVDRETTCTTPRAGA